MVIGQLVAVFAFAISCVTAYHVFTERRQNIDYTQRAIVHSLDDLSDYTDWLEEKGALRTGFSKIHLVNDFVTGRYVTDLGCNEL